MVLWCWMTSCPGLGPSQLKETHIWYISWLPLCEERHGHQRFWHYPDHCESIFMMIFLLSSCVLWAWDERFSNMIKLIKCSTICESRVSYFANFVTSLWIILTYFLNFFYFLLIFGYIWSYSASILHSPFILCPAKATELYRKDHRCADLRMSTWTCDGRWTAGAPMNCERLEREV